MYEQAMKRVVVETVEDHMPLIRDSIIRLAMSHAVECPLLAADLADGLCTDVLTILAAKMLEGQNADV